MKCENKKCNKKTTSTFCEECTMKMMNHNYKVLVCNICTSVLEISEASTFFSNTKDGEKYLKSNKYNFTICKECGGNEDSFLTN